MARPMRPSPTMPTGVAERTGGVKLPQGQVNALSQRPVPAEAEPAPAPRPVPFAPPPAGPPVRDDWRQHQRQVDKSVEQRLAPKILARQHPRDRDAERQRHDGRDHGDAQRQQHRGPFVGGKGEHVVYDVGCTRNVKPYC